MSTVPDILAEASRRKVILMADGDQLKWSAPAGAMDAVFLKTVSNLKGKILTALKEKLLSQDDGMARQRWGCAPTVEIAPVVALEPRLGQPDADLLAAHLLRQPHDVWRWVVNQAGRYAAKAPRWSTPPCEVSAMQDCLLWQWEEILPGGAGRFERNMLATRKLRDLAEAAREARRYYQTCSTERE